MEVFMSLSSVARFAVPVLFGALLSPAVADDTFSIAQAEYDQTLALTPDLENGRRTYLTCAVCHRPEGWGTVDGAYPQIAGQSRTVIVKQLADIRARNRDNPLMYPFSLPRILGGPQQIADVAAYVAQLPMTAHNGQGPGVDLELGGQLYVEHCASCHGARGEGNAAERIPAVAGQHYPYTMRQFDAIREGRRNNADPQMLKQTHGFIAREQAAILDYASRLPVPPEKLAAEGWMNPDFPADLRGPMDFPPLPPMPRMPLAPPGMLEMPPPPALPAYPASPPEP
jgi:cytochrome c553